MFLRSLIFLLFLLSSPFTKAGNLTIELANGDSVSVSYEELVAMPSQTFTTHLPWYEGVNTFTGVRLENLLLHYTSEGVPDQVNVRALNDYAIDISGEDISAYHPILTYLKNGERMKVRDKGPYWLIYSLEDYPEIDKSQYHAQMVWQVESIKIINND